MKIDLESKLVRNVIVYIILHKNETLTKVLMQRLPRRKVLTFQPS